MNKQKSFLMYFAEMIEQYKADQQREKAQCTSSSQPNRLRLFLRWLIPNGGTLILIALLIATQSIWAQPFAATNAPGPSATTVNYQGRLADNLGTPLDGSYGMSFALYDAASAGNLVWGPEDHPAVPVSDGLFSVGLGSRTTGGIPTTTWNGDRYLEITVGGETLSPRELIRSVPIAGMALTVPDGAIGSSQIADGAVDTAKLLANAVTNAQTVMFGPGETHLETTSQSFVDIPGYEITMETTGGPVLLMFQGAIGIQGDNSIALVDFAIDGQRMGQDSISGINQIASAHSGRSNPATTLWIATPPAGTHTFTVQWKAGGGALARLNIYHFRSQFAVIELKR
jgi:hypothetical protein